MWFSFHNMLGYQLLHNHSKHGKKRVCDWLWLIRDNAMDPLTYLMVTFVILKVFINSFCLWIPYQHLSIERHGERREIVVSVQFTNLHYPFSFFVQKTYLLLPTNLFVVVLTGIDLSFEMYQFHNRILLFKLWIRFH